MSRVLVVTNDFPTRRGGIESFVLALCERMPRDEVVVYTASMPGDAELDRTLSFPVYRDPSRILLPTPSVARRVAKVFRDERCDRVVYGASAPLGLLVSKELDLRGSFRFDAEYAQAVSLISDGAIDVAPTITAKLPIDDAVAAFELAADRTRSAKVILTAG